MTPLGYVIIPVGLVIACASRRWLLRLLIISIPFSDSVIANVGSGDNASGIQIWMFVGALWLLRESIFAIGTLDFRLRRSLAAPCAWLAGFVTAAAVSLLMPIYIDGSLQIASPLLLDTSVTPLYLSSKNFTALIYLIFGALIAISFARTGLEETTAKDIDRLWLGLAAFVSLWGLFQFSCSIIHFPFPTALFNNNHSATVASAHAELDVLGVPRMSSVAVEPSILAQCLLVMLPLTVPALLGVGQIFSIRTDRRICVLIIAALLLTFSSLAYIGLVLFMLLVAFIAQRARLIRAWTAIRNMFLISAVCLCILVPTYFMSSAVQDVANSILFSKASGYSGLERLKTIANAAEYFSQYPVFGVGWGSVTSHDLLFKLLANVGLVGTTIFFIMWWVILRRNLSRTPGGPPQKMLRNICWGISGCMLICVSMISEFPYVFGHFWFVLGICIAAGSGYRPLATSTRVKAMEGNA